MQANVSCELPHPLKFLPCLNYSPLTSLPLWHQLPQRIYSLIVRWRVRIHVVIMAAEAIEDGGELREVILELLLMLI
jgi:hypothetical protein